MNCVKCCLQSKLVLSGHTLIMPAPSKSICEYSCRQKATLACLALSACNCWMGYSLMAPFFPKEADSRRISLTTTGWIFAVYYVVQVIFFPMFGKLVPFFGSKFQFIMGNFVMGASTILFGTLSVMPGNDGNSTFTVFAFLIRILLSLGSTASITANMAMATNIFQENAAFVLGLLDSTVAVSYMIAASLGGFLYQLMGFGGPFFTVGGYILLLLPILWFVVEAPDDNKSVENVQREHQPDLLKRMVSIPAMIVIFLSVLMTSGTWVCLYPILEPHLRIYDIGPAYVSVVFMLISIIYGLNSALVGRITDRLNNATPLIVFGYIFSIAGLLCLGPTPLFKIGDYRALWLDMISLVLISVGNSISCVPTYGKMLTICNKAGLVDTLELHALIGGMWSCCYACGGIVGQVSAEWLIERIDFPWCTTIFALGNMFTAVSLCFLWVCEKKCEKVYQSLFKKNSISTNTSDNSNECVPLLK